MRRRLVALMCPAGFEQIAARAIAEDLRAAIARVAPGWVICRTAASVRELRAFPLATNAYEVIATCHRSSLGGELEGLRADLRSVSRPTGLPVHSTFRLRIHDDGTFASTKGDAAARLESAIARWSGLAVSARGSSVEFWVIRRRDLDTMLTTKLTGANPKVQRGVLRPEVCAALAREASVAKGSLVVDPFAGSGSIGLACLEAGAPRVWLNDKDRSLPRLKSWRPALRQRVTVTHKDFRELQDDDVSHIVTDPPWGQHEDNHGPIEDLYHSIGEKAAQLLSPPGTLVVLTGAGEAAIDAMIAGGGLKEADRFPVLINGRKAAVVRASGS